MYSRLNVYILLQCKASLAERIHLTQSAHAAQNRAVRCKRGRDRRFLGYVGGSELVTGTRALARGSSAAARMIPRLSHVRPRRYS